MAVLGERRCGVGSARRHVGAAEQHCSELVLMGLARARFWRAASSRLQSKTDLFLMGCFTVMDAVLEVGMDVLLEQLPVERETKRHCSARTALSGRSTPHAGAESGEWAESRRLAKQLKLPEDESPLPGFKPCSGAGATSGV